MPGIAGGGKQWKSLYIYVDICRYLSQQLWYVNWLHEALCYVLTGHSDYKCENEVTTCLRGSFVPRLSLLAFTHIACFNCDIHSSVGRVPD